MHKEYPYNIFGAYRQASYRAQKEFIPAPWSTPIKEGDLFASAGWLEQPHKCPTCKTCFDKMPSIENYIAHRTKKGKSSGKLVWRFYDRTAITSYKERLTVDWYVSRDYIMSHNLPCLIDLPRSLTHFDEKHFDWHHLEPPRRVGPAVITPSQLHLSGITQWSIVPNRENIALSALEAIS